MHTEDTLVYDSPAADSLEALPLGNGRLGAMVFGGRPVPGDAAGDAASGAFEHRFQLNDSSAWSGSPHSQDLEQTFSRERADRILAESRRLIQEGDFAAAHETLKELQHRHSQSFLPFADVFLTVAPSDAPASPADNTTTYRRTLDLARAVNSARYELAGHAVRVDAFASHEPSVLVISVETNAPRGLDLSVGLDSPLRILRRSSTPPLAAMEMKMPSDVAPSHDGGRIDYSEDDSVSLQGAVAVAWQHDGAEAGKTPDDGGLAATGVRRAVIYVTTETTFTGLGRRPEGTSSTAAAAAKDTLAAATKAGHDDLLGRHEQSHGQLYNSCRISLDTPTWTGTNTGQRLQEANAHPNGPLAADPGLAALLFNYGRYLLISSSRPSAPGSRKGTAWRGIPANLQGIWNDQLPAPWSSNFTANINLQMNYWGAEPTGLAQCAGPLFALIEAMRETGARTAREYYGGRGWAVHHNSDIWAYSKPIGHGSHSPEWSFWPMAGLWLVRHLREHLTFDPDPAGREAFGREIAWPATRGAAEFALDLLLEFPDGTLGTSPSTSPENSFAVVGGAVRSAVAESSTMDITLIRDVFLMLCTLADELGMAGDSVVAEARAALPKIPEPSPGRDGRLREWLADPAEWEPEHRHVSHLYLAYPGDARLTPELETAISASLDGRGDESTGWSLAWKILLRARLRQPHKVSDLFRLYLRDMTTDQGGHGGGLYPNLFGAHPPFQIDGNFGFVAGLAECLLQSHRTTGGLQEIELLPALPQELPDGAAGGLRARPGVEVDLGWRGGTLTAATFTSHKSRTVLVRYGRHMQELHLEPRQATVLNMASFGEAALPM